MRTFCCLLAMVVGAALLAPRAAAQSEPPTAAAAEEAIELGKRALAQFEAGEYAESHQLFSRADQLMHSPVFVLYMARCKRELGKLREARSLYEWVIGEQLDDSDPGPWKQAQEDAEVEHQRLMDVLGSEPDDPDTGDVAPDPDGPADGDGAGFFVSGVVVAGLGVAGLVIGGVLGGMALSKADEAKRNCSEGVCPSEDEALKEDSEALAHGSTAAIVIGSLAVVAGVTLMILPSDDDQSAALSVGPGSLMLSGRF